MLWKLLTENDRILQQNCTEVIQQAEKPLASKVNSIFLRELHWLKFKLFVQACEHRIIKSLVKSDSPLVYPGPEWSYKWDRGLHLCSKQVIITMLGWTKISSKSYKVQRYITEVTVWHCVSVPLSGLVNLSLRNICKLHILTSLNSFSMHLLVWAQVYLDEESVHPLQLNLIQ